MLEKSEEINKLSRALADYKCVSKYDRENEIEGGTLANGFGDLEKSFQRILSELLPKLINADLSEQDACDVLHAIGEEFRHIDYHLHDNRFYSYLWKETEPHSS